VPEIIGRIQAHPSRRDLWLRLIEDLRPLPTVASIHSSEPPSPWEGYKQALRSGLEDPSEPTHLLVLQDDVQVCSSLPLAVERITEAIPNEPICLFLSWLPRNVSAQALRDMQRGARYTEINRASFIPVVAMIWPVAKAHDFLSWAETATLPGIRGICRSDDAAVGHWLMSTRQRIWVTNPSLVEHPDNTPSLIGRRAMWGKDKGRCALYWIGEGADPLDLDWSL
jgi:hypothetical protein